MPNVRSPTSATPLLFPSNTRETRLIPFRSSPVPDAVRLKLVRVAGALPELAAWICKTGRAMVPGNWVEEGGEKEPTATLMVSGVEVTVGVAEGDRVPVGLLVGVLVIVGVKLFVKVELGVGVAVRVGVLVDDFVGVVVGLFVGVFEAVVEKVFVGEFVDVLVGERVGLDVAVLVTVGNKVLVGVGLGVRVGVIVGVLVAVRVSVGVGVGTQTEMSRILSTAKVPRLVGELAL